MSWLQRHVPLGAPLTITSWRKVAIGTWRSATDASIYLMLEVNAEPALVLRVGPRLESVFVFSVDGEAISGIRVVRNPDKLARIDRHLATLY